MAWQSTILRTASASGVGIHGGEQVALRLRPAPPGTGVVFVRTDLGIAIPARAENARDLAYATTLRLRGAEARTVEHLLAAVSGTGVTNLFVDLSGAEVPILDGSALPFVEMVRRAGVEEQRVSLPEMRVRRVVRVGDDERWIELRPGDDLAVDYQVSYDSPAVGRQRFTGAITPQLFASAIAPARTFGFLEEVAALRERGLGLGGSLENCIVVDQGRVLSGALRFPDEFVRHKVLDLIGDLALLEYPLRAHVVAHKAGHALHVAAVSELLANPEAWELVEPDRIAPLSVRPYTGEVETEAALAG
ncbi:MAG: UDP-3-O-acyl-N-acetylglucosamine deacetylase [Thermoanaerobaculaceae bacterium]|nr:UDP-3-O-acyl-N-acetylglucosamine deacetylase [Thermoanaerobaculaceae bacterium]TAM50761.1 MAG: UDP-3-O-[3-hydroxymyristoyl] N-acetylglucosamine deacetylase [Acidobacteriota bacterium]